MFRWQLQQQQTLPVQRSVLKTRFGWFAKKMSACCLLSFFPLKVNWGEKIHILTDGPKLKCVEARGSSYSVVLNFVSFLNFVISFFFPQLRSILRFITSVSSSSHTLHLYVSWSWHIFRYVTSCGSNRYVFLRLM